MGHIYDAHETIAGLRQVVAERGPGYIYERQPGNGFVCIYWDREKGCPSCLVGHLLAQFGFSELPASFEGRSIERLVFDPPQHGDGGWPMREWFYERFTVEALWLLAVAQAAQDSSYTWGRALEEAERLYANQQVLSEWRATALDEEQLTGIELPVKAAGE